MTTRTPNRSDRIRPLDALRAMRALLRDPDDTALVFEIIEALSGRARARVFERFRHTESGPRLLAERPAQRPRFAARAARWHARTRLRRVQVARTDQRRRARRCERELAPRRSARGAALVRGSAARHARSLARRHGLRPRSDRRGIAAR